MPSWPRSAKRWSASSRRLGSLAGDLRRAAVVIRSSEHRGRTGDGGGCALMSPWAYPENRYYYEWYVDEATDERSDGDIKQDLLDQDPDGARTRTTTTSRST